MSATWYRMAPDLAWYLNSPGVYLWSIEGGDLYVGKALHLHKRLREYERNLQRMAEGRPYRRGNPNGFRRIHHALDAGRREGWAITYSVLATCEADKRLKWERHFMMKLSPNLNGPLGEGMRLDD